MGPERTCMQNIRGSEPLEVESHWRSIHRYTSNFNAMVEVCQSGKCVNAYNHTGGMQFSYNFVTRECKYSKSLKYSYLCTLRRVVCNGIILKFWRWGCMDLNICTNVQVCYALLQFRAYLVFQLLGPPEVRSFNGYAHLDYTPSIVETTAGFYIACFNSLSGYECVHFLVLFLQLTCPWCMWSGYAMPYTSWVLVTKPKPTCKNT